MRDGDKAAEEELLALVYRELRSVGELQMQRERAGHTLQPTALVNEAWLKLVDSDAHRNWESRGHFLAVAARAMRQVLVDHARSRDSEKRGAGRTMLPLDEAVALYGEKEVDLLALEEALARLAERDKELARLVELRFFGGLTHVEIGAVMGLTLRQVERSWVTARACLHRDLAPGSDPRARLDPRG
jgi:RNA polymerase sigma-70 factor (ECF subfamily)